jgi:integrase
VYHKHGAYWFVRGGKWTRLGATLTESLVAYARLHEDPAGSMPALISRVLEHVRPTLKRSTAKQYEHAAIKLRRMLAEFHPEQVKPKHVAQIKVDLKATPNMANRCLTVLRIVFAHAVEWQLVESNPCVGIMRHKEEKRRRYLTDAEYMAIWSAAAPRLRVIMDLAYLTGQRISDVLRIRRSDISETGITFQQGKTGERLTVRMTPELETVIGAAKALNRNIVALTLLHNRRGKAPDYRTTRDQWERACNAAGIEDAHFHDIRAKAITDAKRQGLDPQAIAGHASATMTARYIRLRESPLVSGPSLKRPREF